MPAVLGPVQCTLSDNANLSLGQISARGGWLAWNLVAARSGNYAISRTPVSTNGNAVLLIDDHLLASVSGTNSLFVPSAWITQGFHSLKVRSVSTNAFQVQKILISGTGAPASPTVTSIADGDGQVTLSWSQVPGATSYQVRYGVTPGIYTSMVNVGTATNLTVTGLLNNQQYYFVVIASNAEGDSLPSNERGVIPLGVGQPGRIVTWEFNGCTGSESSATPPPLPLASACRGSRAERAWIPALPIGPPHKGSTVLPASRPTVRDMLTARTSRAPSPSTNIISSQSPPAQARE